MGRKLFAIRNGSGFRRLTGPPVVDSTSVRFYEPMKAIETVAARAATIDF
jgi:hypothetical protein